MTMIGTLLVLPTKKGRCVKIGISTKDPVLQIEEKKESVEHCKYLPIQTNRQDS